MIRVAKFAALAAPCFLAAVLVTGCGTNERESSGGGSNAASEETSDAQGASDCIDRFNDALDSDVEFYRGWTSMVSSSPAPTEAELLTSGEECLVHLTYGGTVGASDYYLHSSDGDSPWRIGHSGDGSRPDVGTDGEGDELEFSETGIDLY